MKRAVSGQGGFTLIEMMIVVAIVAVLALIAYPSYQNAVREGRRGDAKSDLIELSQMMERCFTVNNSYAPLAGCPGVSSGANTILPAVATSPQTGTPINYNISFLPGSNTQLQYTLRAVPVPGSDQAKDTCGTLQIDNAGGRTYTGAGINCW
jgi:type IV pilus assembly protein PilE